MVVGRERMEFAEFYEANWERCLRAVAAVVGSQDQAEPLLAEAFARAWASWRKVSRHPAPQAWVVRTALNVSASRWRRSKWELAFSGRQHTAPVQEVVGMDPAVTRAVRDLPARQREVVVLRVLLDLDTKTTARQLGIAPGTVMVHLSRGLATLRRELAHITTEVDQ